MRRYQGLSQVGDGWRMVEKGIAGPKVMLEPKKKKLLVVDIIKEGILRGRMGNIASIMGNAFFYFGSIY